MPKIIYCQFEPTAAKDTYVCSHPDCTLGPVVTSALPIWRECSTNTALILSGRSEPKPDPMLWQPKPGMRDTLHNPCKHLGQKTGRLASCGCHISDWKKEIYVCPIVVQNECLLIKTPKPVPQPNCQECSFYEPKELVQLT